MRTGRYRNGLGQKLFGLGVYDLMYRKTRVHVQPNWMGGVLDSNSSTEYELHCLTSPGKRTPAIWLHGVSVGEVQLLAPVAKRLAEEFQEHRLAVSTTTDSGFDLAKRLFPDSDVFYFPFDFSWAINRTLDSLRPSMIVLSELELWPNLIDIASHRGINLTVINGRLSERSCRGYTKFAWLTKSMFQKITHIGVQNEEYRQRFIACGSPPSALSVTGSIKFDNVNFDRNCGEADKLRSLAGITPTTRVIVVGSTQAPEEVSAARAYLNIGKEFSETKLVIVPRHPDRFDDVFQDLSNLDCRVLRRSSIDSFVDENDWDILVVDSVGELKYWWALAEIALVGGSFGSRGGQNMLEPAAYGANVAFGPNTTNFREIAQTLLKHDAALRLDSLEEIQPWLREQLASPQPGRARGRNAIQVISRQQGAMQRTIDTLRGQLRKEPKVGSRAA